MPLPVESGLHCSFQITPIPGKRQDGTAEIQRMTIFCGNYFDHIGIRDLVTVVQRPVQAGDICGEITIQQPGDLVQAGIRHKRLITLQIDNQLLVTPSHLIGAFSDSIATALMCLRCHHSMRAKTPGDFKNLPVVGCNDNFSR